MFQEFDRDGSGSISGYELRCLLRFLGYPMEPREVIDLLRKFDKDNSGGLDIKEFGMVMVDVEEKQFRSVCEYFEEHCDANEDGKEEMSQTAVARILTLLGYESDEDNIKKTLKQFDEDGSGTISLNEFLELMHHFRQQEKKRMLDFMGFTRDEVLAFQSLFNDYDTDKSGELNFKECMVVLQDFGHMPQTHAQQLGIIERMKESDRDGSGTISMKEFLGLLRRMIDEEECELHAKERDAAEEAGFSEEEVADWRQVFDDTSSQQGGEFTLSSMRTLLRAMGVRLSKDKTEDLRDIFTRFAEPSPVTDTGHNLLFHQFLALISKLIRMDFENLKACADHTVAAREHERQRLESLVASIQCGSPKVL